ncbi:MAG TPA: efflux RND transporter periplasmic adaptor subunit [Desulfatiglandales bacterium]|nr:efflux RND transporter periplasmic adaptor subunit [Desulfatiglandales bacterium]
MKELKVQKDKVVKIGIILIGVLILLGLVFYWTGESEDKNTTKTLSGNNFKGAVPVEISQIHRGSIDHRLHLTGTITAQAKVNVFSKVSGILEGIKVEQGDRVETDQIIAVVEREEKEAKLEETNAVLDALKARWAQMETGALPEEIVQAEDLVRQTKASWETSISNYNRLKNLKEKDFISQQQLDDAMLQVTIKEAVYSSAKEKLTLLRKGARQEDRDELLAQIRQAEASSRLARIQLKDTIIRAPIAGIISERSFDKGALVGTTSPIFTIVAMDIVKVVVPVVESDLSQLKNGAIADIQVDAYPEEVFAGEVVRINPTVDPESRTVDVEIQVENKTHRLKPGMFARVSLIVQKRDGVLLLSKDSLLEKNGSPKVFVHDNGKALVREVALGLEGDRYVEVLSGLKEGEEVIVAGQYNLKDGIPVKIIRRQETL